MVLRMRRGLLIAVGTMGGLIAAYLLLCNVSAVWRSADPASEGLSVFPMQVPGTTLVIENLVNYEGEYMENNDLSFESELAAVRLINQGENGVECARVILEWSDGAYVFDVDMLPPGASAVVLEKYRSPYAVQLWTECRGIQKADDSAWMSIPAVITPDGPTQIHLENPTDNTIRNVTLYYKHYLPENQLLLGGIVYASRVGDLLPGATVTLQPERFSWGNSQIVRVVWEVAKAY